MMSIRDSSIQRVSVTADEKDVVCIKLGQPQVGSLYHRGVAGHLSEHHPKLGRCGLGFMSLGLSLGLLVAQAQDSLRKAGSRG